MSPRHIANETAPHDERSSIPPQEKVKTFSPFLDLKCFCFCFTLVANICRHTSFCYEIVRRCKIAVLLRLRCCCGGRLGFWFCLCGPPYPLVSSLQLIFGRTLVHRDGVVLVLEKELEHNLRWFLALRASFCHSRPRTHGLPVRTGSRVLGHSVAPREDPGPHGVPGLEGLDGVSVSDPGPRRARRVLGRSCPKLERALGPTPGRSLGGSRASTPPRRHATGGPGSRRAVGPPPRGFSVSRASTGPPLVPHHQDALGEDIRKHLPC
jgi:hypothetical protein